MYGTDKSKKPKSYNLKIVFVTQPETEAHDRSKKECRNKLWMRRSSGKTKKLERLVCEIKYIL